MKIKLLIVSTLLLLTGCDPFADKLTDKEKEQRSIEYHNNRVQIIVKSNHVFAVSSQGGICEVTDASLIEKKITGTDQPWRPYLYNYYGTNHWIKTNILMMIPPTDL